MEKTQISGKQFFTIVYSYIIANDLIRGIYAHELKNNTWIPVLAGIFGSVIIFSLYSFIYKNNEYCDFPKAIENILGKFLAKIIFIIYPLYFIFVSFIILRDMSEMIEVYLIADLQLFIIAGITLFVVFYVIKNGIESFGRTCLILFAFFMLTYITFGSAVYLINDINVDYINPILENGVGQMVIPSFEMSYAVPFGELFALVILFQYVREKKKNYKAGLFGILAAGVVLLSITFTNIVMVGPGAMYVGYNPTLGIAKLIDYRNYIQRFDLIAINVLLLHVVVKVIVLIYAAKYLLSHMLKIKKSNIITFIICAAITISFIFFTKSHIELIYFRESVMIDYVNLIFEVIIPLFIVFLSFFRRFKLVKKQTSIATN